ncbi:MAG: 5-(carboxyamino)imidazole ribonucleotide synthase [Chloroflexi bacterium AL-W]|nr:5-(carboxyamino)imidazole ribonucleotide synthase [Chloroflexi bacterium AL-N1]NOK71165.1 5-(carboxyamino)imidazole ribonucleotide synthase [Chloroflexi bacterium AL-N10]NOK78631.1 5-(carboxyamino)imidazole ribonucleotide synthase [Chloroflexi bacterium AL-N5]NOK85927.1 5-(carboxyamino)imidazole ribonucleotide synthase [Chloroflexi bacterium AL-W]NOK92902.1 5-(carboxyamino)imidazole ribonucleotide synthase [Chloroflexi bacterium AL-N15]
MRIGILGGGQLGRMLALDGYPLGFQFRFLDPTLDAPVNQLAEHLVGAYDDIDMLHRFADGVDVVTYEFENVPVETVRILSQNVPVYPPPQALEAAQDRLVEKRFLQDLAIPTPPFVAVNTRTDLEAAIVQIGLPAVLKTRRLGYDGKGQYLIRQMADVERAWVALGITPLILEGFVSFTREVSILAVRGRDGTIICYPLVENEHRQGILWRSLAPAPHLSPELQAQAVDYATRVLDKLKYVGVLAIEFFQVVDAQQQFMLLANEMAPRVHNSGHWTIEGAETSQFENHVRAIAGLPLGDVAVRGCAAMLNLIGTLPDLSSMLAIPGTHVHLYGKAPRHGRKLGHVTLRADEPQTLTTMRQHVETLIDG